MRRYAIGILAGWAVWVMLIGLYMGFTALAGVLPGPLQRVAGYLTGAAGFAAWPIGMYGFFAWGESGWWMRTIPNVAIGVFLYGALGLIGAALSHRSESGLKP